MLVVDVAGFWRPLLNLFAHMRDHGFIRPDFEVRYLVAEKIADVLPMLEAAAERAAGGGPSPIRSMLVFEKKLRLRYHRPI